MNKEILYEKSLGIKSSSIKFVEEYFWSHIKKCRPDANEDDVKILKWISEYDLLIIFNDDEKYIYDSFTNFVRQIKYKNKYLSEEDFRFEFKERLQQLLGRKHITQKQFAKDIGLSQPLVSKYISGTCLPNTYTVTKMLKALDCKIEDLMFIPTLLDILY